MEQLRNEIVESQKARFDLLKWKIIAVATIAGFALGLQGNIKDAGQGAVFPYAPYLLCIIPLVCAYIDLLCQHLNIRILVIGEFLSRPMMYGKTNSTESVKAGADIINCYESYCKALCSDRNSNRNKAIKKDVFGYETFLLYFTSIFLSVIIIPAGMLLLSQYPFGNEFNLVPVCIFSGAGLLGIISTILISISYKLKLRNLTRASAKLLGESARLAECFKNE